MRDEYQYALIFALLFTSLGWLVPAAYYMAAPDSYLLEIEGSSVEEGDGTHHLEVEYSSNGDYFVDAEIILYKQGEDKDVSVQTWRINGRMAPGEHVSHLTFEVDGPLKTGELYYYEINARYYPGFNVEKATTHKTEKFTVENGTSNNTTTT